MKIYSRYLLKNLIWPTLFVAFSLTAVVWLTQSLKYIDLIVNQNLPIGTFFYFIVLLLPSLFSVVLPISLYCASIYVYNKLLYESELLVLTAAGISRIGIAKSAIVLGLICTFVGYSISLYFLPVSYREFRDLQFYLKNHYASVLLQEGIFNTPADGLTVYIKDREDNGSLKGILVHDNRVAEKSVTMLAESADLERGPEGVRFIMHNASRQEIKRKKGEVSILYFDSYPLDLTLYAEKQGSRFRKKDERFLPELFYPEQGLNQKEIKKLTAEGHERLSWPLLNFAMPILAVAILMTGDFNRRGQSKHIIAASVIAVGLLVLWFSMRNLAAGGSQFGIAMMYASVITTVVVSIKMLLLTFRIARKNAPPV